MAEHHSLERLLSSIAVYCDRHYRRVFAIAALLLLAAVFFTSRLRFDPDVLSLLPVDDPAVRAFREAIAEFGGLDLLLVVERIPEGAAVDPYLAAADELGRSLSELDELEYVEYRIGDPAEVVRRFYPQALFFTGEEERAAIAERLSDEAIAARVPELKRQLTTPQALARKQLALLDPLGMAEILLPRLSGGRGALGVDWSSGYYLSKDRRLLLLLAKPTGAAQDIEFADRLVQSVEERVDAVIGRWPEIAGEDAGAPPEIVLGGGYLTALDDASLIRRDVVVNAVSSVAVVLLLFLFAFRRMGLLLYAFIPLSAGLLLNFGLAGIFVDKLSSATSVITALLVGLGIDFVIVSYGRYVEERNHGVEPMEALRRMTGSCGRAVVIGGVTSAATFYSFAVTEFSGLRQMGVLTATGILLCMAAVLILLPAMLAWSERRHARKASRPRLFVHGFGAAWLVRFCLRHPRKTLWVGVTISSIALILLPGLGFEWKIQNLRPDGNRGIQVQSEVATHFGTNFKYMMMVVSGDSRDDVLDLTGRAGIEAQDMVERGVLARVDSISSLVPPPSRQLDVLAWLSEGRADGTLGAARIRASFEAALAREGMRAEPFAEAMDLLGAALGAEHGVSVDDIRKIDGTAPLLDRYLRHTKDGWKSVIYLYPPPSLWRSEAPPSAEALANKLGNRVILTGVNVVSRNLRHQVAIDAVFATILGTLLVTFLLWLDFRDLTNTLLALLPLTLGIIWMLGTMVVLGVKINFMNIFVTTMIIGIGVDYGIHMLHRYRELESEGVEELIDGLSETGRSVAMAAVTTSVGFGSLVLSHYPGLRSIGFLAILGAVSTALVAITLLPTFLVWRRGRRG